MTKSRTPRDQFKKALRFAVLLAGISLPLAATAQQTEAERAALSERPLTEQEQEMRLQGCTLPPPASKMNFQGREFSVSEFPDLLLLALVAFDQTFTDDKSGNGVQMFPLLPVGGIGYRDTCGSVVVTGSPGNAVVALWIRQTLDFDRDYPSSIGQITKNGQIIHVDSSRYMVLPFRAADDIEAVTALGQVLEFIKGSPVFAHDRHVLWMRGAFFLPLADTGGDQ